MYGLTSVFLINSFVELPFHTKYSEKYIDFIRGEETHAKLSIQIENMFVCLDGI